MDELVSHLERVQGFIGTERVSAENLAAATRFKDTSAEHKVDVPHATAR